LSAGSIAFGIPVAVNVRMRADNEYSSVRLTTTLVEWPPISEIESKGGIRVRREHRE
jgi:hypothetical protein